MRYPKLVRERGRRAEMSDVGPAFFGMRTMRDSRSEAGQGEEAENKAETTSVRMWG